MKVQFICSEKISGSSVFLVGGRACSAKCFMFLVLLPFGSRCNETVLLGVDFFTDFAAVRIRKLFEVVIFSRQNHFRKDSSWGGVN